MVIDTFPWPTPDDYTTTLQNLPQLAVDPRLRTAQVEQDFAGNIKQHSGAGLYTCNFKITLPPSSESPSGRWMMRCFCSTGRGKPPSDIRERYREINAFCNANLDRVSVLLPLIYIEQALQVFPEDEATGLLRLDDKVIVPVVMMPLVEKALPLGTYIAINYKNRQLMEDLCRAWFIMLREMEEAQVAHGDLDLTNVLVLSESGLPMLKLIDYDNMWTEALSHLPQTELGHEGFQHPALTANRSRPYDITMDRFASLSIYISMRALSLYPELYGECSANDLDRLLFSRVDYKREIEQAYIGIPNDTETSTITKLYNRGEAVLMPYLNALRYALYYDCMPEYDLFDVPPDYGMYGIPLPGGGIFTPTVETTKDAPSVINSVTTEAPATTHAQNIVSATVDNTVSLNVHTPPRRGIPVIAIIIAVILLIALIVGIVFYVHTQQAPPTQHALHFIWRTLHQWAAQNNMSVEWSFL